MELSDQFVRRSPRVDRSLINYGIIYYQGQKYLRSCGVWRRQF